MWIFQSTIAGMSGPVSISLLSWFSSTVGKGSALTYSIGYALSSELKGYVLNAEFVGAVGMLHFFF